MSGKKKVVVIVVLVLLVLLFVLTVWLPRRQVEREEEKAKQTQKEVEELEEEVAQKEKTAKRFALQNAGNCFYLTDIESFREKLSDFFAENGLEPSVVNVLGKYEDDQSSESGKARFYLQLDDGTLVYADYNKDTNQFSFSEAEEEIENIEDYGGMSREELQGKKERKEEPEYETQGLEELDFGDVQITDNEGQLAEVEPDEEQLKAEMLTFLEGKNEERRNISVLFAQKTDAGYEAAFLFENPRADGCYIWVTYEKQTGLYQMEFKEEEE